MKNLIREIHRRSLWQVLGIYVGVSWIVLQVIDVIGSNFGLPGWVPPAALILLLLGLPVVLATAFVQEGIGRSPPVAPDPDADSGASDATEGPGSGRPAGAVAGRGSRHHVLTWRRAVLGGVGVFTLLGVAAAGYTAMRALGIGPAGTLVAKGLLEERATIVVADFASADASLSRAATQALRVDLSQSPVVRLADDAVIAQALARMERPSDTPLDLALARQLAQREGLPAVIGGEINQAGAGFVLTVALISAEDGEVLASQRSTASNENGIVAAIDALSKGIRERIGESLRSLGASPPLERVTTGHMAALRKYTDAIRVIDVEGPSLRAVALLEEAVAIDSGFAMAWRQLGTELANRRGEGQRVLSAMSEAMAHADRLPDRERHLTRSSYYMMTFQHDRAVRENQSLLALDPDDPVALNNLGFIYAELRDFERAEEYFVRAVAVDSGSFRPLGNLIEVVADLGRFEQAGAYADTAEARFGGSIPVLWTRAHLAATAGDYEGAGARFVRLWEERAAEGADLESFVGSDLGALRGGQGRVAEARGFLRDAMAAEESWGLGPPYLFDALQLAWLELDVRGDPAAAGEVVDRALERFPILDLAPADRPYLALAEFFAAVGQRERASRLLSDFEAETPGELRRRRGHHEHRVRAEIELALGRTERALEEFRAADVGYCLLCPLPGLARAYEAAGEPDSVAAVLERYATTPWFYRFYGDDYQRGPLLGPTYERLAGLYDEGGDVENAARYYARFVELWVDADEELQPRVRAARARLEAILRERG